MVLVWLESLQPYATKRCCLLSNIKRKSVTLPWALNMPVTLLRNTGREPTVLETKMTVFPVATASRWDAEPDATLVDRMTRGTPDERAQAFDAFYRRHAEYLFGICFNLANRYKFGFFSEDDIFQATMLRARDHAHTFDAAHVTDASALEDAVDLWLSGIAKSVVADQLRRIPRCVPLNPELLDADDGETDDTFAEVFESGDDTEIIALMREAVETLSPREQEVVWAVSQFYVCRKHQHTPTEELDEIVASLGVSKEYFRQIKLRARRKIKQYMAVRQPLAEAK